MDKYSKNIFIGFLGYYLIMTINCIASIKPGTSIIASRFDAFLFCTCLGWISIILSLFYPVILIIAIFVMSHLKKYRVTPFLISSSLVLYAIGFILAQHMFGFFKKEGELWQPLLIAGISCFIGFILDRKRIVRNGK